MKRTAVHGLALALFLPAAVGAQSPTKHTDARPIVVTTRLGDDRFLAGGSVRVDAAVPGDLIAAGGMVDVGGAVGGDAIVTGGDVRVDQPIGGSLYAAGGRLLIQGVVADNARVAGGQVEIGPRAMIDGNVSVGGGEVRVRGPVGGYLQAAGGSVLIDAAIGGDAVVTAGSIRLGPNAQIAGSLRYASRDAIDIDASAKVAGGVVRMPVRAAVKREARELRAVRHAGSIAWSLGLVALAAALAAALPRHTARVAETVHTHWALSLLIGFIALVCVPVAAMLLLVTIIGVPLALLAIVAYPALLLMGYVVSGAALGLLLAVRMRPHTVGSPGMQALAAALGMLAVTLLARVPYAGGLVILAALLIGMGALLMQFRGPSPAPAA